MPAQNQRNSENLYILRYCLPPEPQDARPKRLELLRSFCAEAKIDEVMFFIMPEEYNRGQYDPAHYRPWLEFAAQAKEMVEAEGMATSLNPWITTLHASRGRGSAQLKYRRMVSDTGVVSKATACHICPDFHRILLDTFTDFAQAGFKTIWVEDDFRFHNHDGGWGGCFCDEHLRVLRQRGAQARTRSELVTNINAAGQVHPDRIIWIELMRDTAVDLATMLRQAMDAVDPAIELGLMCSNVLTHALEGRDWEQLVTALGGAERVPIRPHAQWYSEHCRAGIMEIAGNLSATLAAAPAQSPKLFELENCPMSRYSKSNQQTAAQGAFALEGGCDGLTLDVLSFIGHGPLSEPGMAATLAGARDKFVRLRELVTGTESVGVVNLVPTATPLRAPGAGGDNPGAVPNANYGWSAMLAGHGIPVLNDPTLGRFRAEPEGVYALAGAAVWGVPDDVLQALLARATLLLDATAADIIRQRGLGAHIGLGGVTWHRHGDVPFTYQEALTSAWAPLPERSGVNLVPDDYRLATFDLDEGCATPRTRVVDADYRDLGTGIYEYRGDSGRGMVLPVSLPLAHSFYDRQTKLWLDRWLGGLGALRWPALVYDPWVYVSVRQGEQHRTIFLWNTTFEVCESMTLRLPADWAALKWQPALHGRDRNVRLNVRDETMTIETEFVGSDWLMLVGRA